MKIALQAGGVADYHDGIVLFKAEVIPRSLLLGRIGRQRIGPGQIDPAHPHAVVAARPAGKVNGFSGPISGVLVHTGQGVEDAALADVWVACQGDGQVGIGCGKGRER